MKGAREVKQKKKKKIGERKKQRNTWRVKLRPVLMVCCEQTLRDHMMMMVTAIIGKWEGEGREILMNRQVSGPEHAALCACSHFLQHP